MRSMYEKLMRRCIRLAKKGEGKVSPNPMVGAVIFDDNYKIISEGFHGKYGENHAERNAILKTKEDLKGKSIIVNLEPCSHYGKTPPCADLIIEKGFKRVITGMIDPNPRVSGRGIEKLKRAGIEVITGVLEKECLELNEVFVKNQLENMPYLTIKTAVTLDGKIASKTGDSKWITDEYSRREVQKLRNKYDAIMTSVQTVIKDNPQMNCRIKNGRNPVRVIADTNLITPKNSRILDDDGTKVIIASGEKIDNKKIKSYPSHIKIIKLPLKNGHIDIKELLKALYNEGIMSVMTEAGAKFNKTLIEENLADRLIYFLSPKILGDRNGFGFTEGFEREKVSECNNLIFTSTKILKNDIIINALFKK